MEPKNARYDISTIRHLLPLAKLGDRFNHKRYGCSSITIRMGRALASDGQAIISLPCGVPEEHEAMSFPVDTIGQAFKGSPSSVRMLDPSGPTVYYPSGQLSVEQDGPDSSPLPYYEASKHFSPKDDETVVRLSIEGLAAILKALQGNGESEVDLCVSGPNEPVRIEGITSSDDNAGGIALMMPIKRK